MKLLLVLATAICAALMVAGCGETASPQYLGSWVGSDNIGSTVTIEVAGTAGHYTAQFNLANEPLANLTETFSGGNVDSTGNLTFDKSGICQLTLGPVSGGEMTAYFVIETEQGFSNSSYDMSQQ